jgi:HAD superfamily hydrolase (TIGR01509 family)
MRAVLFDLGNTLVSYYAATEFTPILQECLRCCAKALPAGIRLDDAELLQRAIELNGERPDHAVRPLAARLEVLFGEVASDPTVLESLTSAFLQPIFATARPDADALPLLASLRGHGFLTAIVSNTPWGSPAQAWLCELARHGLLPAVDAVVFCVDVGYRKPHPAPMERALQLLGVRPSEALFVGDDPHWDVLGAQRLGIQPLLLARHPMADPVDVPVVATLGEVLERARTWSNGG